MVIPEACRLRSAALGVAARVNENDGALLFHSVLHSMCLCGCHLTMCMYTRALCPGVRQRSCIDNRHDDICGNQLTCHVVGAVQRAIRHDDDLGMAQVGCSSADSSFSAL